LPSRPEAQNLAHPPRGLPDRAAPAAPPVARRRVTVPLTDAML